MSGQPRRAVIVLGMHRSGTSAVTRLLALAGGSLPREVMPPTADNPQGYWESRRIARFNSRLLESAGTRWNDDAAIPADWFTATARRDDRAEAATILAEEFAPSPCLVFKDPRVCRLLPFWRAVFADVGIEPYALVVARDPVEVARSLAARAAVPEFRPAAIPALSRGLLLWLRYVLDAERHSRDMVRSVVRYDEVVADWRRSLAPLFASGVLPEPSADVASGIDASLDPGLRRQRSTESLPAERSLAAVDLFRDLLAGLHDQAPGQRALRDQVATSFDRLHAEVADLRRDLDPVAAADPGAERLLAGLVRSVRARAGAGPAVVFLSAAPGGIGHVYRVEHAAAAIREAGWTAEILPLDDAATAPIERADMVVVFRGRWGEALATVRERCTVAGIPLVYDVDDLLFDPQLTAAGGIAFLEGLPPSERDRWIAEAVHYREAVERADAGVFTTPALAAAAAPLCRRCLVLPNSLDRRMEAAAAAARATPKRSAADGRPRIVFASGTPTHHRDFTVAAEAIARVFDRRPGPVLVIIGYLDPLIYPGLRPFADRIEQRPPVPLLELFAELAACDVNLCPLELGNPFCEAKSGVRWLAASAVGLPSVVSPTGPLRDVVADGVNGLIAAESPAWEAAIERVLDRPLDATAMGETARGEALTRFGFEAWSARVLDVYSSIMAGHAANRAGAAS